MHDEVVYGLPEEASRMRSRLACGAGANNYYDDDNDVFLGVAMLDKN